MQKFALLLTTHNRCETTVTCLKSISEGIKQCPNSIFDLWVVDANSKDGTPEAVKQIFPEANVICVADTVYWNQGMRIAWSMAQEAYEYDGFFWINDDTVLKNESLRLLIEGLKLQASECGQEGIIAAAFSNDAQNHCISYGGYRGRSLLPQQAGYTDIEYFNGNLVLVSRNAFMKVGLLCPHYSHRYGDIDYGYRARSLNVPIWLAPGTAGYCKRDHIPMWMNPSVKLRYRLKATRGPKGISWREIRHFKSVEMRGHWLVTFIHLWIRVFFPALPLRKYVS